MLTINYRKDGQNMKVTGSTFKEALVALVNAGGAASAKTSMGEHLIRVSERKYIVVGCGTVTV